MDDATKPRRGVRFSVDGQQDRRGNQTTRTSPRQGRIFGRDETSNGEEYDAAYAATVAAVAYAIAAREKELATQESPDKLKLSSPKKPSMNNEPSTAQTLKLLPKTDGIMRRPRPAESSTMSRLFSGKEVVEDDYDDELGANVSVRRPLKPAHKKPEDGNSGQNVVAKVLDSAPSIRKDPNLAKKLPEKKASQKFEQEQAIPMVPQDVRPSKYDQEKANQMPPTAAMPPSSYSSKAEAMADAWEKEKMSKIKSKYNVTMETVAEWETEKKAESKNRMQQKEHGGSDRKRAMAVKDYTEQMARINKVAAASRLTAEDKRRRSERKVREKAETIRSTGKLPRSCACF
ncbi:hypothetical protein GUJ93_ZPchr0012g21359 [Zizania palustris]|uniref:Remorin C-terminal domain-containing protein n=1 Tax=Zizania palustris TaxID=103762 RepID=A0A8J5WH31_ZIZPA|nr:hypothetical protein GUJ93_ZPchr0012g21359 [Zizania palustris]